MSEIANQGDDRHCRAFDVESIAEDYGVNVVSAVRPYGNLGPFRPRRNVDFRGVRLFDVLLRQDQILCSSTVSPGDASENLYGKWGVIIGTGSVEQAFPYDATTSVVDDDVISIFLDRLENINPEEQMSSAIHSRALYNEVNVRANTIAGVYYCTDENDTQDPTDFPSQQTNEFIDELSIPSFRLESGEFYPLQSPLNLRNASSSPVSPTELTQYRTEVSDGVKEKLVSYLVGNLVLAPRNAVSSGVSRGDFAHEYRARSGNPYLYEDFLFEQSKLIDPKQRLSLRTYGAVALYQFARRSETINMAASDRARRMAQTVLSLEEFNDLARRIETNGQLSITYDDFSHYLKTGDLPDYIKDH